ncbi:fibronectin type III domain-containing protein [Saccharothrix sp. S26]|uniref:fibronectin type III domain-containing protein n=1 Tax=Saccharothrix sp. S26 TaxID=2907215 RepID=UPI001F1984C1|nr:fibronectin type III domain-containing protein [Saccharothrix sp. S26]MCE6996020.1 fibronectin type III domain-containing protein [Saccharothrix sp. S26]
MGISTKWRGRVPVALLTAASLTVAGLAIGGASGVPQLEFLQPGHWVLNSALGKVFHVDGSTKRVNAEVAVPGADPGSLVVQSDTSGYVVGKGKVTEFGKSTLRVEGTTTAPTDDEVPVALQVAGGPYLVYRRAGKVVRLGTDHTPPISVDEPLGNPVATPDGTVWLHYTRSGRLCRLSPGTTAPSCPATVAGHTGGLTVVGEKPLFVDTTSDTVHLVEDSGLTRKKPIGTDVPDDAEVGPGDVAGLVPVLDRRGKLHLVDGSDLVGDRPAAETNTVPLEPGDYTGPLSTGSTVAVLDQRSGTLHTYDHTGGKHQKTPVPPERGTPRLSKGDDARVYVDSGEGKHVLVVDPEGKVTPVQVNSVHPPTSRSLLTPPTETTTPPTTTTTNPPPPVGREQPTTQEPPPAQQPTRRQQQTVQPPPPPVVPASPPGTPGNLQVAITSQVVDATVTWTAALDNGAPVTAYHVSWTRDDGSRPGSATVPGGGPLSYVIAGIWSGADVPFTVTVVAENSAGRGTPASARTVPQTPVKSITLSKGPSAADKCGRSDCYWMHVVVTGFEPNTRYNAYPKSTDTGYSNPGYGFTTEADGSEVFDQFYYFGTGHTVWVTIDGVESNRLEWR